MISFNRLILFLGKKTARLSSAKLFEGYDRFNASITGCFDSMKRLSIYAHGREVKFRRLFAFLLCFICLIGCKTESSDMNDKEVYEGPIKEFENIKAYYSDSAKVKMQMTAARHLIFENQDEHFPKGVFIELFDEEKVISTQISADEGFKINKPPQFKLVGNVIIKSLGSGDELNTEILYLDQIKSEIHTDAYVTIKSEGEVHTGEGMTSNLDFTRYKILKPSGTITVDEDFK